MAPPKAPGGKGPKPVSPKGKKAAAAQKPPLTPREIHAIVFEVLGLAALAEGPTVLPGSRMEASLHTGLRRVREVAARAVAAAPLAVVTAKDGTAVTAFTVADFSKTELFKELTTICRRHKKHMGSRSFSAQAFANDLYVGFARWGAPIDRVTAASMAEIVDRKKRGASPSAMAGAVLGRAGLPATRQMQNLLSVNHTAERARAHLGKGPSQLNVAAVQEFLTCLQIDREDVLHRAQALLALRRKRRKGHGDYALRDASPGHQAEFDLPLNPPVAPGRGDTSPADDLPGTDRPDDDPDFR